VSTLMQPTSRTRREVLCGIIAGALSPAAAQTPQIPIIDSHIHFFDTTRPQGVPYPRPDNPVLWKPALPDRYRGLAKPLGIVGAIEVEASPWLEDNFWVLDIAAKDNIVVGTVGNLEPEKPEFREYLDRLHKNPMFRGIRCGNIWGRDLAASVGNPKFIEGMRLVAQAGLVMDTANPDQRLLDAVVRLSDAVPNLRLIVDHLPNALQKPRSADERAKLDTTLAEIAKRPQIYLKVSEVIQRNAQPGRTDVKSYLPVLDRMWSLFGEDRLMFGSDWPNWDTAATLEEIVNVAKAYVLPKGRQAAEKFFWRNSLEAYRWVKRSPEQPGL
jgi:L-fuconolactonase